MFHAGTRHVPAPAEAGGDRVLADGGRVPGVTAFGPDLGGARERAYAAVDRIDRPGGFCRRDIRAPRRIRGRWSHPSLR
jgi:phosphoribosylamine---glycine ligase